MKVIDWLEKEGEVGSKNLLHGGHGCWEGVGGRGVATKMGGGREFCRGGRRETTAAHGHSVRE